MSLSKIIKFSIAQRWLILLAVVAIAMLGVYNFFKLPIDAVPDITNVQVQINTQAAGFTPYEVEKRITFPIETAMSGLPNLDYTRSLSRYGLSQITVVFKDNTNIYLARQLISERLQLISSSLPPRIEPAMGPISTGLGEIFMYTVDNQATESNKSSYTPTELRTIQDWVIKPQLKQVPGVTEINTVGGFIKQYHITPYPKKLLRYNLHLEDVVDAIEKNNSNVGAGFIERNGEQYLIRSPGKISNINQIKDIVIKNIDGAPIKVEDVADVNLAHELRSGAATENGHEVVLGTAIMLIGENSRTVSQNVAKKLEQINTNLPDGVEAKVIYNRATLVDATIHTVRNNLLEGALLVGVVLVLFLGNIRAALITAAVIPLSMLLTITGMLSQHISANLMSLGALDFGLIVDGAVIVVENCIRQLGLKQTSLQRKLNLTERLQVTAQATNEVVRASFFGVLIITAVYIPILTLTGIEHKMYSPMAKTVIMALLSSLLFTLTFIPAAVAIFLRGNIKDKNNALVSGITVVYKHLLQVCFKYRYIVIALSTILVAMSVFVAFKLGAEFMPHMDEGDIALHALRITGTSLSQSVKMQSLLEDRLRAFPEVKRVVSKIGTPEIATDPAPPNVADTYVIMKPRNEWPDTKKSKSALVHEIEMAVKDIPGNNYEFSQPIQMRFNELISGVRSDVAVKVFGDNRTILLEKAEEIEHILQKIPGSADVKVEPISGLPLITIQINRKRLAQFGLHMQTVQNTIRTALNGQRSGVIYDGDKRFEIIVRLPEKLRTDTNILQHLHIRLPSTNNHRDESIPLSELASLKVIESPNQISRENGKRRIVVTANVRNRDLSSFVNTARSAIDQEIKLPSGYWIKWGGQFEQLESAIHRLTFVVPITLLLIFVFLFTALKSVTDSLIVFTGIPLALTGGVFALWFRHMPFSISAAVGFIALSGIAVLNGLVMVSFITKLRQSQDLIKATIGGAITRLRPVLMTALVASLGFVPMAISVGTGSEVQRPLATVVIGGIVSSTILTLLVLPGLYYMFHRIKGRIST